MAHSSNEAIHGLKILTGLLSACLFPAIVYAQTPCDLAGTCDNLPVHATHNLNPTNFSGGACETVTNNCAKALMVPYNNTLLEWNNFIAYYSSCAIVNPCLWCAVPPASIATDTPPSGTLCAPGDTASVVSGIGPWWWTCTSSSGAS